jgi:hypothetical protein
VKRKLAYFSFKNLATSQTKTPKVKTSNVNKLTTRKCFIGPCAPIRLTSKPRKVKTGITKYLITIETTIARITSLPNMPVQMRIFLPISDKFAVAKAKVLDALPGVCSHGYSNSRHGLAVF